MKAIFARAARAAAGAAGLLVLARVLVRRQRPADGPAPRAARLRPLTLVVITVATLGGAAAVGGAAVMISGIVPIKASSGHWPITAALLQFAKRRSVDTHTIGTSAPPLDDPRLALQGARHYQTACRPCHGSPGFDQPRIARRMTPPPPELGGAASRYDPEALFYIVKHGIKFTGMPAWPTGQRDDEVWAMVAFLQRLNGLDARGYSELAEGAAARRSAGPPIEDLVPPATPPRAVAESCSRCHGVDGLGVDGAFPRLAGQRSTYLTASLLAYARGERHSGVMAPVAAGLGMDEMREVAEYYASLPAPAPAPAPSAPAGRGERIAREGLPDSLVPACLSCHAADAPRNPHYPRLAGQPADYLVRQLTLFKQNRRGGTAYAHVMRRVASQLTEEDMRAVASYFAPRGASGGGANR
jgi:cytochrome c553